MKYLNKNNTLILLMEEDLTAEHAKTILETWKDALEHYTNCPKVTLDLNDVHKIDAQGLSLIIALSKECFKRKAALKIKNRSEDIQKLMTVFKINFYQIAKVV